MQHRIGEETAEPGAYRAGCRMVGQGRRDDTGNDRPGFAKPCSQNEREQLRLVADFGQGNDCSGDEQGIQHQVFLRGGSTRL